MMLFVASALAAPVQSGLQANVQREGLAFLGTAVTGQRFEVGPLDLAAEVSCYDLTVDDFNLDIDVQALTLDTSGRGVEVDVTLDVQGTYIDIAGASGWIDTCIDFARLLELVAIEDARLQGTLEADVVDGAVVLGFRDTPTLTGTVITDADWFPDTLVWSWVEGMVIDQARQQLEAQLPTLVVGLTEEPFLIDPLGTAPLGLQVAAVEAGSQGLSAAVSVDFGGPGGAAPMLQIPNRGDAHFAVGLTEPLVRDALGYAWQEGLLDPSTAGNQALIQGLIDGLELGPDVEVELALAEAPQVGIDTSGTRLTLTGLDLEVRADGEVSVELEADLAATLDVAVDGGSLALSVHDVDVQVDRLEADALFARDDADQDVAAFLEGWVASAASTWVRGIPLYDCRITTFGYVIEVVDVRTQPGGLVTWIRLHDEDDPSIDRTPPDATLDASSEDATIRARFGANEDEVQFSWRLDGGGWSSWSETRDVELAATPGSHQLEVRARDGWHNVDPTPATATLELTAPAPAPTGGCSTLTVPTHVWGWLLRR